MDKLTDEERKAIAALQRLAKKWPESLMLVHQPDSGLHVMHKAEVACRDEASAAPSLAKIKISIETSA